MQVLEAFSSLINIISIKVTGKMNAKLTCLLNTNEIEEIVKIIAKGKACRLDGIGNEFFQKF